MPNLKYSCRCKLFHERDAEIGHAEIVRTDWLLSSNINAYQNFSDDLQGRSGRALWTVVLDNNEGIAVCRIKQ